MAYNLGAVVSHGFSLNEFMFTYVLDSGIDEDDVGKAVSLDATKTNTVKLAADGDAIFGRLETFEDRTALGIKVGTVSRKFKQKLPVKSGLTSFAAVAVGDTVVGAGDGEVKASNSGTAKTPDPALNVVIEIGTGFAVVEKL